MNAAMEWEMYLEDVRDERSAINDKLNAEEDLYRRAKLSEREGKAPEGPEEDCNP